MTVSAVSVDHPVHWSPPPANVFKCNVDASLFAVEKVVGLGMAVRNSTAEFIAARIVLVPGVVPLKEAEAMGLLEAVR